ncbi:hypothetical protein Hypma_013093 [Hypsizygus marmoreus]|uniref:F-box domain-containing protein n=1 Tax=Hypsizygus marmoreus TaxID=39966 RepID=A0A369JDA4_HYPMA|nr:hypothetical protein Hypma_013093 [Hypsizygus marmoreus]
MVSSCPLITLAFIRNVRHANGHSGPKRNTRSYRRSATFRLIFSIYVQFASILASSEMPDIFPQKRDAERFIDLLNSPHSTIAAFIQRVTLHGPDLSPDFVDVTGPEDDYNLLNTLIINNLPLLLGVRSITISTITWRCLRPEAKAAIGSLPRVSAIRWKSTAFGHLSDLLVFSSTNFPSLEKLKIRLLKLTEPDVPSVRALAGTTTSAPFPRVRFLDFRADRGLRPLLSVSPSSFIRPQNMETLCLGAVYQEHFSLVRDFVKAAGPALRRLALDIRKRAIDPTAENSAFPVSLNRNTNLETLEISLIVASQCTPFETSWLHAIIGSTASPVLKTMTFWFSASSGLIHSFDFRSFEDSLVRRKDLPALARVNLKFAAGWWKEDQKYQLKEDVNRLLPELHGRGMLDVCTLDPLPPSDEFDKWSPFGWC